MLRHGSLALLSQPPQAVSAGLWRLVEIKAWSPADTGRYRQVRAGGSIRVAVLRYGLGPVDVRPRRLQVPSGLVPDRPVVNLAARWHQLPRPARRWAGAASISTVKGRVQALRNERRKRYIADTAGRACARGVVSRLFAVKCACQAAAPSSQNVPCNLRRNTGHRDVFFA